MRQNKKQMRQKKLDETKQQVDVIKHDGTKHDDETKKLGEIKQQVDVKKT